MTEVAAPRAPGTPCWVTLLVHGLPVAQDFYSTLFGWSFQSAPDPLGPYVLAQLDGEEMAGIGELAPELRQPVAWTPYFATHDAHTTADLIHCSGGTVGVGPVDLGDAGRLAICSDPAGAIFGIWQAKVHVGAQRHGRPGTAVWNELLTPDISGVSKFYETVFGYGTEKDGPDALKLLVEGTAVASIRGVGRALPKDCGPHWMTYFEVPADGDVDAAAARVVELGGRVLRRPYAGPWGRMAEVADPEGAAFTLVRSDR